MNTQHAILARAEAFARTHRLNIYKKGRLGNQYRWALKAAGYPPEIVEFWTYPLVTLNILKATARNEQSR
jgi:hypothetical protein